MRAKPRSSFASVPDAGAKEATRNQNLSSPERSVNRRGTEWIKIGNYLAAQLQHGDCTILLILLVSCSSLCGTTSRRTSSHIAHPPIDFYYTPDSIVF